MEERVQKFLSRSGVASRRQAEQMMLEGRVTVNGAVVRELGVKVDPDKDAVKVDGKRVHGERPVYVLLFKPKNTICTLDDPEQRPTVMELVRGVKARLFPVGRLDFDTTGALLLTNDGELANLLMHPRHRFTKTYLAKVKGIPTEERLEKLRRGVNLEGVRTAPAEARIVAVKEKNSLVELVLREGRNRQVKRMFLEIGYPVIRLHRSGYAFLGVEGMAPGEWRYLEASEVARLRASAARADGPAPETDGFKPALERPLRVPRASAPRSPRNASEGSKPRPSGPRPSRSSASKPRDVQLRDSKYRDSKPHSGKPGAGGRSASERPTSGRPTSGRPTSGRPASGRPAGAGPKRGAPSKRRRLEGGD
jgi:pseudouridine synthase